MNVASQFLCVLLALYFAQPLLKAPTPSYEIEVFWKSSSRVASFEEPPTVKKVLSAAASAFHVPSFDKVYHYNGVRIFDNQPIPEDVTKLVVVQPHEWFFLPSQAMGEVFHRQIQGKNITIESVSLKPRIFVIDGLLDESDCDHIISAGTERGLIDSEVGGNEDHVRNEEIRTSRQAWIFQYEDELVQKLTNIVADIAGGIDAGLVEALQVLHYDTTQYYHSHHDFFYGSAEPDNQYLKEGGNRLITFLFYLNDVEEGGATVFPMTDPEVAKKFDAFIASGKSVQSMPTAENYCEDEAALKVFPKRGRAVMFYNLFEEGHMDGNKDYTSLHSGCPIIRGEKWACNLWVRNKYVNGRVYSNDR